MIKKKENNEPFYSQINYSNTEVIQWLLRFYYEFQGMATNEMDMELVTVFMDIDRGLKQATITNRQREALRWYMEGWTEEEIGIIMGGISQQAVHKLIHKVCIKLSNYLHHDLD